MEISALLISEMMVIMIHAKGSMEASRIELYRSFDYESCKASVREMMSRMPL